MTILGITFERRKASQYREELVQRMQHGRQALVVTPNAEMLVASTRDPSLKDVLNRAALRIVDGFGPVLMSGFGLSRFPGVDVLAFVCEEASKRGLKVLLAGGIHKGDAEKAAATLKMKNQKLNVAAFSPGRIELTPGGWRGDEDLKQALERERPDVVALALGHGKQEKWLADHLKQFPSVRLGIGVGGAIEFYAGRQVRAPILFRRLGLEWLYRLWREPRRLGRIFTAVVIFPVLVLLDKISHNP